MQGDVLSGSIAAFLSWALQYGKDKGIEQAADKFPLGLKPHVLAAWGACCIARNAAARAYEKKGRSMLAGDHMTLPFIAADTPFTPSLYSACHHMTDCCTLIPLLQVLQVWLDLLPCIRCIDRLMQSVNGCFLLQLT